MKFKNKEKVKPLAVETPPPVVKNLTENQLQEQLKGLQTQLAESQTKTVMLQGAVQMVELQIQEMNNPEGSKTENTKNGVN